MNQVVLIGRLTKEPELRYTQGGTAFCRFVLAVDRGLSKEKKEELQASGQPTADFIPISTWGKTAETAANYLDKGRKVAVMGSIQTGSFVDKNNQKRYTTEVLCRNIEFLEWKNKDEGQGQATFDGFDYDQADIIPF